MSAAILVAAACVSAAFGPDSDPTAGGNRYRTTHSMRAPFNRSQAANYNEDTEGLGWVKEYHFHTYFHLVGGTSECGNSCKAAQRIREALVAAVKRGDFVAVCHGVTNDILPAPINQSDVPPVNMVPRGPHPAGSFETWVPVEHLPQVLSFFLQQRGELSILMHPLTVHAIEDHSGRAMWLGQPWYINLEAIDEEGDPLQYPELGLGYSKKQ
eukprot:TRINITY_DN327_c0_g2_i1.p1 TRINITY_DN327_c0_g2~~TRINITY_DN327_c0_g2_i1.p1  ORF type:complete len:212 (+),score=78.76 TRINITY_DN327_c0_g2_i1:84-719(+)